MDIEALQLLMKLYSCNNHRTYLAGPALSGFHNREQICQQLATENLIDFSREVATVKIASPGLAILALNQEQSLLSEVELKVLARLSSSQMIPPSQILVYPKGKKLTAAERDIILENFEQRGFIEVKTQIKSSGAEVWLTEKGLKLIQDLIQYFQTWRETTE